MRRPTLEGNGGRWRHGSREAGYRRGALTDTRVAAAAYASAQTQFTMKGTGLHDRSQLFYVGEKNMDSSRDLKDWLRNYPPVAYGVSFGIIVGAVVSAITQNPVWIALGIPIGAAVGAAFQALRK